MSRVLLHEGCDDRTFRDGDGAGSTRILKVPSPRNHDAVATLDREHVLTSTRICPAVRRASRRLRVDGHEALGLGANSHIRKPVDSSRFVEAIRHLGLHWPVINEPPPPTGMEQAS